MYTVDDLELKPLQTMSESGRCTFPIEQSPLTEHADDQGLYWICPQVFLGSVLICVNHRDLSH